MELESSTLIMTFINFIIIFFIISFFIFMITKIIKNSNQSKNINGEILKELKSISSKLDKKD